MAQGDEGAYDDSDELGTTELNVDNPGDSPWTTSAGGRQMLMPGIRIAIALGPDGDRRTNPGYAFTVGETSDPVAPSAVTPVDTSAISGVP